MEREVSIKNFIGIYDNYILPEECNKAINLFEAQQKLKNTLTRAASEKSHSFSKKDSQYFATADKLHIWYTDLKVLMLNFDMALKHYEEQTGVKESLLGSNNFEYTTLKIQKTLPGEGYHVWHVERTTGFHNHNRALAFSIYLNDVEEGGETEFLHHSIRVKPKRGRIAIWPAGFPYVHRGNPPLKGEKYILTSWMMLPRE